jgi:hypothetical protein
MCIQLKLMIFLKIIRGFLSAEPHIDITSAPAGEQIVHFMIFCPTERATHLEQLIRRDFMEEYERAFPRQPTLAEPSAAA